MAFESKGNQEVKDEQSVVDLEAELVEALEESDNLSKEIDMKNIQLVEVKESEDELIKKTLEKEAEIKALQNQLTQANFVNLMF